MTSSISAATRGTRPKSFLTIIGRRRLVRRAPLHWTKALADFRRDRRAMRRLAADRRIDLFAKIPHGTGQTYLRAILLAIDHGAYHIAQIVDVRRALGNWKKA